MGAHFILCLVGVVLLLGLLSMIITNISLYVALLTSLISTSMWFYEYAQFIIESFKAAPNTKVNAPMAITGMMIASWFMFFYILRHS